jgi:NAD(P)-dependent dehydrogenase (short-subunit alcohol dehydrogenase family)
VSDLFSLSGRVAVVTGGSGVLGGAMARGLARAGARVGVLARRRERLQGLAEQIAADGGEALPLVADVLDRERLEAARAEILDRWGALHVLVNAAGGNVAEANTSEEQSVFDIPEGPLREVLDLNFFGTLLPTQVFGEAMAAARGDRCIVNVSSMAVDRALTRVVGYSAGKAAAENLTRWLAVEAAKRYGPGLRVNAVAPGFFLGEQNRAMLVCDDGELTERGRAIVDHTPAGRFGEPEELIGTLVYLCSPAAAFVTGVVVPVDGGFSAFGGV